MKKSTITAIIAVIFFPHICFAHGAHGGGFFAGFTHTIYGLDHALTILGLGIISYYFDSKRWYLYPIAFIIPMVIGGVLGTGQVGSIFAEKIIASSVILIGLSLALLKPKRYNLLFVAVALIGAVHGFAHGTEMPEGSIAIHYIPGFLLGAILLSGIGIVLSKVIAKTVNSLRYYVLLGGFIAGAGFIILHSI